MPYLYQFDIHHIFPREMFSERLIRGDLTSPTIGEALASIFQGQSVSLSLAMEANKIGLFSLPGTIANLSTLVGEGFGTSNHGFHTAYNQFLIDEVREVLSDPTLSPAEARGAVLDLHYIATELAMVASRTRTASLCTLRAILSRFSLGGRTSRAVFLTPQVLLPLIGMDDRCT